MLRTIWLICGFMGHANRHWISAVNIGREVVYGVSELLLWLGLWLLGLGWHLLVSDLILCGSVEIVGICWR